MSIIKNTIYEWGDQYKIAALERVEREYYINESLKTVEGECALAQAMTEPIRRALEYQVVGRRLMLVDELPQGALARYEHDIINTIER